MTKRDIGTELSVIIPVGDRHSDPTALLADYQTGLAKLGHRYEIIFVLDGPQSDFAVRLQPLVEKASHVTVITLTRSFGEATALMAGFERATGEVILTLPAYFQIEGGDVGKLIGALQTADVVVARRWPRAGGPFEVLRRNAFHGLIASITGMRFRDLGCGARAMRRAVLEEIALYGDQHRFLALLADRQGFRVKEIDVRQSPQDRFTGHYRTREYAHRALDIFTVFFLTRFTKKPLRFFGMVGATTFGVGALFLLYLVIARLFFDQALADRPALLLSSLLVVLGLQLFALGLLGELIIFTHAKNIKDYQVDEVIQYREPLVIELLDRSQGESVAP
jgi:glycosyltransferase involved in cell wall biosynthesis